MFVARPSKGRQVFDFRAIIAVLSVMAFAAPARQTETRTHGVQRHAASARARAPYSRGFIDGHRVRSEAVTLLVSPSASREGEELSPAVPRKPAESVPRENSSPDRGLRLRPAAASRVSSETIPLLSAGAKTVSATDLVVFGDTALAVPLANRNNQTPEPSLAINDQVIFSTGNHYAQLSTDGGKSFTFIDPAGALPPPLRSGFCCDQRTTYVPSRDLLVWILQYAGDASGNTIRLAVSKGQTNQAARVFSYFDLTPQNVRASFPAGFVLDTSDVAFSDNFLYITADAFTSSSSSATFVASIVLRFSLDSLAASQFTWDVFTLTDVGALKPVQGATDTMFFLTHPATSAVRLLTLPENASVLSYADVAVTPYVNGGGRISFCPDPNGVNPCGGADDRVAAAWRSASRGEIGVMWNAAQGETYPLPYTQAAVLREADGALINEAFIWSPDVAWQYPSAAVNARGDVAGTISLVGPQTFVSMALWISDDVNSHSLSPLEYVLALTGSHSPAANQWGNFFTTRPHSRLTNLWGTVAVADTQAANGAEPHFILFGRSRDGVTPSSPEANFTFSPDNPRVGQTVNFRDLSLGAPTSWSWDYADGRSSTLENPVHVFGAASTYNVTLTAESSAGSSVITKSVVVLSAAPRAPSIALSVDGALRDPLFDSYDGSVGQAITFTAGETDAIQWLWDFGDGTSASGKSVVKTYARSGTMLGHLTVYGDGVRTQVGPLTGNFTMSIVLPIRPPPSGAFTVSGVSHDRQTGEVEAPLERAITFEATETHASQYLWYFGDGTAASGKVVTKVFTRAGAWTVKLVVFGDGITTAIGPTVVGIPVKVIPCTRCARVVPFH